MFMWVRAYPGFQHAGVMRFGVEILFHAIAQNHHLNFYVSLALSSVFTALRHAPLLLPNPLPQRYPHPDLLASE